MDLLWYCNELFLDLELEPERGTGGFGDSETQISFAALQELNKYICRTLVILVLGLLTLINQSLGRKLRSVHLQCEVDDCGSWVMGWLCQKSTDKKLLEGWVGFCYHQLWKELDFLYKSFASLLSFLIIPHYSSIS